MSVDDQLEIAYARFCNVMGFKQGTWRTILEFTMIIGPRALFYHELSIGELSGIARLMQSLSGPHGETLLKVYKVKRYSLWGRVWGPSLMIGYSVVIAVCLVGHLIKGRFTT